jgi:ATP-dependent Clp protease ATP-binding subunit ClpB
MRSRTLDPTRTGDEAETLEAGLKSRIVGQDDAVHEVVEMYQMYLSGMSSSGRPIANLMFLGPTGSGKTRLVEATAECLLQDPNAVIKIDCGEFQHSHEISKLIGSPPGYVGHRETSALLTQQLLDRHHTPTTKLSIVLFDEIEKASDALWNLLLGILDKATLTLGDNTRVNFSRAMIFMTSNVGAREMGDLMKPRLGFARPVEHRRGIDEAVSQELTRSGLDAAARKFTPEFINRLDKMVVFKPLGMDETNRILDIELNSVRQRVQKAVDDLGFVFALTPAGRRFLLNEGTNVAYGARYLKRAIERLVVQPLSRLIASDQIQNGDAIRIDHRAGSSILTFSVLEEGLGAREMKRLFDSTAVPQAAFACAS